MHGSVFNLPFKLNYLSNFYNNKNDLKINFGKIKLNFENKSYLEDYYSAKNQIRFLNSNFTTSINNKKNRNIYELISNDSKINQTDFDYSGTINIKPFYFNFNFEVSNLNFLNIIFFNKIFEDIFTNFFLNNNNLNGKINIDMNNMVCIDDDLIKISRNYKTEIGHQIICGYFDKDSHFNIVKIIDVKNAGEEFIVE